MVASLSAKAVILAMKAAPCLMPTIVIRSEKGRAGVARRVLRCSVQRVIVGVIIRLLTFFSLLQFPR